nr:phosphotransferase [Microbacterium hydrocarbonoxydans]
MDHEQELPGGNASGTVVRAGDTVRKLWTPATRDVHAFMAHVRDRGVDAPSPLGRDAMGRQIVEYVPGRLAIDAPRLTHDEFRRVGALIRKIHDASETFFRFADARWETAIPAPGAELVCHNDLAPWNLVIGERWVFIDWDAAAPSTRLWDLAYAAQAFTLSDVDAPVARAADDLRALVDGYGADVELREQLPSAMHRRAEAMLELLTTAHTERREPWASMFSAGHGSHWTGVVDHVHAHRGLWLDALTR